MKILTWNCNQGIGNDFSAIKDFDADVVIIQECEKLDKNSFPESVLKQILDDALWSPSWSKTT